MAQSDIKIGIVQANLLWENKAENLKLFDRLLGEMNGSTDLIILPEMFTTGFSMQPTKFYEEMGGETMEWMAEKSSKLNAVITGSIIIKEESNYYNRLIWMRPDGSYAIYDKRHRFSMAGEHEHYTEGKKRLIVTLNDWKICPMICYDLRFPVWARNNDEYDLLLYTANWPSMRIEHWKALLRARAIENQAYVLGVNRVGEDGNGYPHSGDSMVFDAAGHILHSLDSREGVETIILSMQDLTVVRKKLPFLADRDGFTIKT